MPRTAPELVERIEETRESLRSVIAALVKAGIRNHWVAEAANWSPGFLSQALGERPSRVPGPEKVRSMVIALALLAETVKIDERWLANVQAIAERYDVRLSELGPPIGYIRQDSASFLSRSGVERFVENYAPVPGVYVLDGPPQSGLTTALRSAAHKLRDYGSHVVELRVKRDLLDSHRLERANEPKLLSALVAAIQRDDGEDIPQPGRAQASLSERFREHPRGFALVIDELDALPAEQRGPMVALLRDWRELQSERLPGFSKLTVWVAWTSDLDQGSARDRSWFEALDTKALDWLSEPETRAIVERFIPVAIGSGAWRPESRTSKRSRSQPSSKSAKPTPAGDQVGDRNLSRLPRTDWIQTVAALAQNHFGGQPQLTHQFAYELASSRVVYDLRRPDALAGIYKVHVERVCDALLDLFGESGARKVVELVADSKPLPVEYSYAVHKQVGIAGADYGWRSPFYAVNVPKVIDQRIASYKKHGLTGIDEQ